jgi:hypothetical protein
MMNCLSKCNTKFETKSTSNNEVFWRLICLDCSKRTDFKKNRLLVVEYWKKGIYSGNNLFQEVNDIINELNQEVYVILGYDTELDYTLHSNGSIIVIKFMGVQIWNSDSDEREFNEDLNEYEDLKFFIIKKTV